MCFEIRGVQYAKQDYLTLQREFWLGSLHLWKTLPFHPYHEVTKEWRPKSHFWRNFPYVQLVTLVLWPENLGMKLLLLLTCSKASIKFWEKNWVHFLSLILFGESISGERSKECLDKTCVFFYLCKDETSWPKKLRILLGDCYIELTVV